ncbi:MAG: ABC transporter ATP-binding protein [Dehalococcoidia bacterium]|tara:strand:+ start:1189 stop:2100 length:912 start_codon:yes stop_codon:yes gene_type:complete
MTESAIVVKDLKKSYGDFIAVNEISFEVLSGEIFALLGANGAGKTTTLEILEGHRNRTSGDVTVLGYDPEKKDQNMSMRVGIVLQETGIEPYLKVEEVLKQFSGFYNNPRNITEVIEATGLKEQIKTPVRKLSGGQRRRVDVALGLIGDPDLIFLDEPTTGFDPSARRDAWSMISNLKSLGKTVILTTHYMDEAEYLSDRIALMVHGKIERMGTTRELINSESNTTIEFSLSDTNKLLPEAITKIAEINGNLVSIITNSPTGILGELTHWAIENSLELDDLAVRRSSLEDLFLKVVGSEDSAR